MLASRMIASMIASRMFASRMFARFKFTRFDIVVLSTLLVLVTLMLLMLLSGDQIGVRVVAVSPADGAANVSTQTDIRVTFDQPVALADLTLSPPVSGTMRQEENTLVFSPVVPLTAGVAYTVNLPDTLVGQTARPLQGMLNWQFQTRQPRVLYIASDADNNDQLYTISPSGIDPVQLTRAPLGIADYALSPDAATIVYAVLREDGGTDLWMVKVDGSEAAPLLLCPESACLTPVWAPDGQRLIYERRDFIPIVGGIGPPVLWWLDLTNGETTPLFDDEQAVGYSAAWSPDGQWISYVSPGRQGVQLYNLDDGRNYLVPSRLGGGLAVWHPLKNVLLVSDIQRSPRGNVGFSNHLMRVVPDEGELVDLTGEDQEVDDRSPAWAPDGEWIAFTRQPAGVSMGKQIWVMRADGSEAHYLTADPDIHHGLPVWSPDGRTLAFQHFPLKDIGVLPTISLLDVQSGEKKELVYPGRQSMWLP
jgi:TolB protein